MNTEKLGRGHVGKKRKEERAKELIGTLHQTKDGTLEIIGYEGNTRVLVRFIETGYQTTVSMRAITTAEVHDRYKPTIFGIGYVDDKFSIETEIRKKAYNVWHAMLKRCTDPNNHNYNDVTVHPRWHSFKNFCEDIRELEGYNHWVNEKGYALDKDIKVRGNRTYSKEFCKFVTVGENAIDAISRKMEKRWLDKQAQRKPVYQPSSVMW
ncbi:hypothetical protein PO467_20320 [Enterobacter kobei]|uniref:hypothetical protein n=1 Tax=Enterobacter TaxID=547 RepID=UPI0020BE351F|nr:MULTISPECIES: hypothetical protein [Enterobacter]HBV6849482.1 hypothetical protein [Klebsiella pneumoniae]ELC0997471.1 hypothetical protein [Enterobacter kobei]MCL5532310.1 hypothetical protein [Enterobacter kobei]HCM9730495.1 hypothetical protein [Enterobacter kobei]HDC4410215.1 hypothetical protein [Enterobacter kobei]